MEHRLETTVLQGLYGGHKGYIGTMEKKMETASLLRLGQTLQVVIFVHVCHPGRSKRKCPADPTSSFARRSTFRYLSMFCRWGGGPPSSAPSNLNRKCDLQNEKKDKHKPSKIVHVLPIGRPKPLVFFQRKKNVKQILSAV